MILSRINIADFKNIVKADIVFSPKINCICGNNGEGKTNLLDAVYYLSMTKSFLSPSDRFTLRYGAEEAILRGSYDAGADGVENIAVSVKEGGRKSLRRNGKEVRRISDHIGRIPVVMVSPSDISLIHDSGEERRRFLNMMLSQTDRDYLRAVMNYNRVLRQRNVLLKQDHVSRLLLDTLSEQMAPDGDYIHRVRSEAVGRLAVFTSGFYALISGGKESVSMGYSSDLSDSGMLETLSAHADRDRMLRYTSAGIQRDDIAFLMDGHPLRRCASQGQQKSFLVALKMAQYAIMRECWKQAPILLLDDVFDKLDTGRVASLVSMVVKDGFGQIFITDSDKVRIGQIVRAVTDDVKFFHVEKGSFYERI